MKYVRWLGACGAAVLLAVTAAVAMAAPGDRAEAERLVAQLERDPAHKELSQDAVRQAREYLDRGQKLRQRGDDAHASIADGVAREWAELGRDLVRAADVEQKASAARRAADDAGAQLERERALLEEGIAQNGRLRAQLEAAEREKKQEPEKTSRTATRDAGAKPAPASKSAPDGGKP
jgi:hypothetical protein